MLKFSEFPLNKTALLFFVVLGVAFFSNDTFAQTENEKVEDHISRSSDRPSVEESLNSKEASHNLSFPSKPSTNPGSKPTTANQVKRDLPAGGLIKEGESKKESPSTLSFNIFLYIVDKFKENKAD